MKINFPLRQMTYQKKSFPDCVMTFAKIVYGETYFDYDLFTDIYSSIGVKGGFYNLLGFTKIPCFPDTFTNSRYDGNNPFSSENDFFELNDAQKHMYEPEIDVPYNVLIESNNIKWKSSKVPIAGGFQVRLNNYYDLTYPNVIYSNNTGVMIQSNNYSDIGKQIIRSSSLADGYEKVSFSMGGQSVFQQNFIDNGGTYDLKYFKQNLFYGGGTVISPNGRYLCYYGGNADITTSSVKWLYNPVSADITVSIVDNYFSTKITANTTLNELILPQPSASRGYTEFTVVNYVAIDYVNIYPIYVNGIQIEPGQSKRFIREDGGSSWILSNDAYHDELNVTQFFVFDLHTWEKIKIPHIDWWFPIYKITLAKFTPDNQYLVLNSQTHSDPPDNGGFLCLNTSDWTRSTHQPFGGGAYLKDILFFPDSTRYLTISQTSPGVYIRNFYNGNSMNLNLSLGSCPNVRGAIHKSGGLYAIMGETFGLRVYSTLGNVLMYSDPNFVTADFDNLPKNSLKFSKNFDY